MIINGRSAETVGVCSVRKTDCLTYWLTPTCGCSTFRPHARGISAGCNFWGHVWGHRRRWHLLYVITKCHFLSTYAKGLFESFIIVVVFYVGTLGKQTQGSKLLIANISVTSHLASCLKMVLGCIFSSLVN